MKKFFIVLLLVSGMLYASGEKSTRKIYHTILSALVKTETIRLYVSEKELRYVLKGLEDIDMVENPKRANIVIVDNEENYEKIRRMLNDAGNDMRYPLWFATNYRLLKEHDEIIGALYWKKGRSQLLFIRKRLRQDGIVLPKEFRHYTIEEL